MLTRQIRLIGRRLRRSPLISAAAVLTIALGIGGNTAVFSVLEGVLLRPLPYPRPERLVGLWESAPGVGIRELPMSASNYFVFREQNRVFRDIGLYAADSVAITGQGRPRQVPALDVTDGTLPLLGVRPAIGRVFTPQDDGAQAAPTIVLAYGYWQSQFGGDRGVLGRTLVVDGKPRQVVGVLPRGLRFLDLPADVFLPLPLDPARVYLGGFNFQGIARLKPGVTLAAADADVGRMLPIVLRSYPPFPGYSRQMFEQARFAPSLRPLKHDVVGNVGQLLWILMASLGLVLLIACANVANLLLARTESRRQELAVRAALGAGRRRIAAELWLESVVLAVIGGTLGLAVAGAAVRLLVALAPRNLPRLDLIALDGPVLLFARRRRWFPACCSAPCRLSSTRPEARRRSAAADARSAPAASGIAPATRWWWCKSPWRSSCSPARAC